MKETGEIEINASQRTVKCGNAVCGSVITGTDKIRSGYGNGDCLYFDFKHGVFAIADATERFPWASRDLLNRLSETLSLRGTPGSSEGWKDLMNAQVYSAQKYQHKTTFSCVALDREGEGGGMVVIHGGDSVVTVINPADGSLLYQTGPDMNFAGRSLGITDVSEHRYGDRNVRVIISSDGFGDLFRFCLRQKLIKNAAQAFSGNTLAGVCGNIHEVLDNNRGRFEHDDIGFILIDPFRAVNIRGPKILIGGTRPNEEKRFLEGASSGPRNRWVPAGEWREHESMFSGIGITVAGG